MGMAAAQARLLSITTRLSDNELRAQIINNDKMRLATESSQASENYITALNEAQYMFSNYDKDSNISYKKLTYNALTSYNAYNNQYALMNSSGQIIVSERDAVNFVNSNGELTEFLKFYGLEEKTSYFDDNTHVLNVNDEGFVTYTYFGNTVEPNQNSGLTRQQLEAIFFGTEDAEMIGNIASKLTGCNSSTLKLEGYYNVQSSQQMYNYMKALNEYIFAKNDYTQLVKASMLEEVNKLIDNKCNNTAANTPYISYNINEGPTTIASLMSEIDNVVNISNMSSIMNSISSIIDLMKNTFQYGYDSNSTTLEKIQEYLKKNAGSKITDELVKGQKKTCSDGEHILFYIKQDENGNDILDENFYIIMNSAGQYILHEKYLDSNNDLKDDTYTLYYDNNTGLGPGCYSATVNQGTENEKKYIYRPSTNEFTEQTNNDLEHMKQVAIGVLESISTNLIDSIWNPAANIWHSGTSTNDAYQNYKNKAEALGKIIYGDNVTITDNLINKLDDISTLYNNLNTADNPQNFNNDLNNDFYPIYLNILLDNIMDTYGEPKLTWMDNTNINENGEAKYNWYKNLFNKMQKVGYSILKDGLASSPDWIRFAFESGIVTMEQFDKDENWNPLIYTNCSDITTQTDDIAVAKAEAEYKAAMNKIENKDKRYDLELKNIDTEHNSLQTEYDTIKATLDKHIERTFKLYS